MPDRPRLRPSRRHVLTALPVLGALPLLGACGRIGPAQLADADLPGLPGLRTATGWPVPGIGPSTFRGRVTLLNVWASWCPYCRGEHDMLKTLSADPSFAVVGLVWRDTPEKALAYLREAGNPYDAVGIDTKGVYAAALRQRGVPNSYVVDRSGAVVLTHRGAIGRHEADSLLLPAIRAAV